MSSQSLSLIVTVAAALFVWGTLVYVLEHGHSHDRPWNWIDAAILGIFAVTCVAAHILKGVYGLSTASVERRTAAIVMAYLWGAILIVAALRPEWSRTLSDLHPKAKLGAIACFAGGTYLLFL